MKAFFGVWPERREKKIKNLLCFAFVCVCMRGRRCFFFIFLFGINFQKFVSAKKKKDLYVPEAFVEEYRDKLLVHATVVKTPNNFIFPKSYSYIPVYCLENSRLFRGRVEKYQG